MWSGLNSPVIPQIHDRLCSMDPPSPHPLSPLHHDDDDEWDTEGFVIPSLGIENPDHSNLEEREVEDSKTPFAKDTLESIYLGPHGAPPQAKQQEPKSSTSRKQRFKQKLKEADRRTSGTGRENRVETLKELIGGSDKASGKMPKCSSKDWLDQHCDEALFERRNSH